MFHVFNYRFFYSASMEIPVILSMDKYNAGLSKMKILTFRGSNISMAGGEGGASIPAPLKYMTYH